MKYTMSVLVENHPGTLSKVSGLFSRRGFNIDSLAVGVTEDPTISRMTLIKVAVGTGQRAEIIRAAELMGAKVADATRSTLTLEYADTAERTETLEALLRPYGIREIVRTGIIAIEKGADPTRKDKPKADAADPG